MAKKYFTNESLSALIENTKEYADTKAAEVKSEVNGLLNGKLDKTEHNKIYSRHYDSMSARGWYRIAKYDGINNINNANGAGANSCEIKLQSGYANLSCSTHHIQLLSRYYNSKFQSIFDYGAHALFSKIRHVIDNVNNIAYIDVYYDYEKNNGVAVEIINGYSVYPDMWWEALPYYLVSETNDNEVIRCIYELGTDTTLINSENIGSFIPTKVSQLENDLGFINTADQLADALGDLAWLDAVNKYNLSSDLQTELNGKVTITDVTNKANDMIDNYDTTVVQPILNGTTTVPNATSAVKATQDASGNTITTHYATKSELPTFSFSNGVLTINTK